MYHGLGAPMVVGTVTNTDPIALTIDPNAADINLSLPPELTQGPYIPPPNSGTASALLNASITANAPSASDVLQFGTIADKAALIPTWGWIAGAGVLALVLTGGRRR